MGTMALETKPLHGIKRVPQCNHIGSTVYYRGEALRYTEGTPKPHFFLSKSSGKQFFFKHGLREVKVKFN